MSVAFGELRGELRPAANVEPVPGTRVILSNISRGALLRPAGHGITIRFVGRGAEHYSIAQRYYGVGEGEFMVAPQALGSEVEIRRTERVGTLGLCIYLPELGDGIEELLDAPIVLPASCELGIAMKNALARLNAPVRRNDEPERIAREAQVRLERTILELDRQVEAIPGLKRRTRFEAARRMNIARAYLHRVTDRAVPLAELAEEAAISPFQLLRGFRDCFGQTPADYHRRLRLTLARAAAESSGLTLASVANQFGFATGSSFSHAYRRTFGTSPVRRGSAEGTRS